MRVLLFTIGMLVSSAAFADQHFVRLSLLSSWADAGKTQSLVLLATPPPIRYNPDQGASHFWQTGLSMGFYTDLSSHVHEEFGGAFMISSDMDLNGLEWLFGLPSHQNYAYHYQVDSWQLMLVNRLLFGAWHHLMLYLGFGLGYSRNHAHAFRHTPLDGSSFSSVIFRDEYSNHLAYQFGAGLAIEMGQHVLVSLGYRYLRIGDAPLAPSSVQTTGNVLDTEDIGLNSFLFSIQYLW